MNKIVKKKERKKMDKQIDLNSHVKIHKTRTVCKKHFAFFACNLNGFYGCELLYLKCYSDWKRLQWKLNDKKSIIDQKMNCTN